MRDVYQKKQMLHIAWPTNRRTKKYRIDAHRSDKSKPIKSDPYLKKQPSKSEFLLNVDDGQGWRHRIGHKRTDILNYRVVSLLTITWSTYLQWSKGLLLFMRRINERNKRERLL